MVLIGLALIYFLVWARFRLILSREEEFALFLIYSIQYLRNQKDGITEPEIPNFDGNSSLVRSSSQDRDRNQILQNSLDNSSNLDEKCCSESAKEKLSEEKNLILAVEEWQKTGINRPNMKDFIEFIRENRKKNQQYGVSFRTNRTNKNSMEIETIN